MKIPNYDTKSPTQGRSLCNFLDEDFRLLISGQSGCGKTNTVLHILRKPLVYYDKIHFFTPNQHQDKIVDLQKVMKPISKKVGYEVLELHSPEEIMDTSEYPSNNRKVVVFDDLVNAPDRIQSKIANHWTDGRHHGISPIYLSQSYYDVPQKIGFFLGIAGKKSRFCQNSLTYRDSVMVIFRFLGQNGLKLELRTFAVHKILMEQ